MNDTFKMPANDNAEEGKSRSCSICGKPQLERFRPFCSKRCADLDLSRWLKGTYAIPAVENDDQAEDDER
jgi:uncharacterized protein